MLSTTRTAAGIGIAAIALVAAACAPRTADEEPSAERSTQPPTPAAELTALEDRYDTTLGVHVLDTQTGRRIDWRSERRFPFASTIKAPLAGAVLDRVSREDLDRVIHYEDADLVSHSPVTENHVHDGMTLRDVIDAALRFSDNTATNLMFDEVGGPAGLDRVLDRWGDRVTNPVRGEPDLNTAVPGDTRDTTTPRALATTVGRYVLGRTLPRHDRDFLRDTMERNTTGDALIRAAVPEGWVVADRTGGADHGVRNAVAVAFPPGRKPILVAVMSTRDQVDEPYDDAVVAEATRVALTALGH